MSEVETKEVWFILTREADLEGIYSELMELLERLEDYTCTRLTGKEREKFLVETVKLTPEEIETWPFEYTICTKPNKRVVITHEG
jgi:hypothetical protein